MKKRNRLAFLVVSSMLTIGAFNYIEPGNTVDATENNLAIPMQTSTQLDQIKIDQPIKQSVVSNKNDEMNESKPPSTEQQDLKTEDINKEISQPMPDKTMIDGYEYANLMDRHFTNQLKDLVKIVKEHNAALYGIEYSDCLAVLVKDKQEPIMMISAGYKSADLNHLDLLCDMHPEIKDQILEVAKTGVEKIVPLNQYESYHITKIDGNIEVSY